jgi:hypothetical protein
VNKKFLLSIFTEKNKRKNFLHPLGVHSQGKNHMRRLCKQKWSHAHAIEKKLIRLRRRSFLSFFLSCFSTQGGGGGEWAHLIISRTREELLFNLHYFCPRHFPLFFMFQLHDYDEDENEEEERARRLQITVANMI